MNIVKNLPALTRILASLPGLHTYKKQMDAARKAGEPEAERAAIRAAETKWGNYLMKKFDVDLQVEGKARKTSPRKAPSFTSPTTRALSTSRRSAPRSTLCSSDSSPVKI